MAVQVLAGPVIPHSRARVGVPGGDLDVPEVNASIEHGRDEGMTEHMRVRSGDLDAGTCGEPSQAAGGGVPVHPGAAAAEQNRAARSVSDLSAHWGMIRLGTSADLADAASVYRRVSLSNAGDRDNLLAHPEFLILGPEGLEEGRTHVAEQDGSLAGLATWAETADIMELEDLFVDPGYRRRGIATALVSRIAEVLRARGVERLEVTANPHALGFYRAAGFVDCGVAETDFGAAPRMVLAIS